MTIEPAILTAKVMHRRLSPKINAFTYRIYYLFLPLAKINKPEITSQLAINRFSLLSFHTKDHNNIENDLQKWIDDVLRNNNIHQQIDNVILIAMPRILGYVFNPISFWLCFNAKKELKAVLCEVNNTFGEKHNYLCLPKSHDTIHADEWLEAEKIFHVSPFLKIEGKYKFRFSIDNNKIAIWINYYNKENNQQLATSLIGKLSPMNKKSLWHVFTSHPLITFKTIFLIHWQAMKLLTKKIKFIPKPKQQNSNISKTR
ncbi:MAG: DUF1365 domain-containing protein [Alphaproteobacteria bacterium]|nr:DUF1365 domain-containing protein [Alphaproteobacteria bacterium]